MSLARYAASALGAVAMLAAGGAAVAATFTGPDYPPPGGVTFAGSGNRLNAGGAVWTYSGFDLGASGDLYYAFAGGLAFDGNLTGADGLYFDAAASDLANGIAVFTGATSVVSFGSPLAVDTRMTLTFTDLANNALALTTSGAAGFDASGLAGGLSGADIPTLLVLGDFKVRQEVAARFSGGGAFSAAGSFFDGVQGKSPAPSQRVSSFGGGFYSTSAGVPEPGVWALMIAGFGGAGAMLRRRRGLALTA